MHVDFVVLHLPSYLTCHYNWCAMLVRVVFVTLWCSSKRQVTLTHTFISLCFPIMPSSHDQMSRADRKGYENPGH